MDRSKSREPPFPSCSQCSTSHTEKWLVPVSVSRWLQPHCTHAQVVLSNQPECAYDAWRRSSSILLPDACGVTCLTPHGDQDLKVVPALPPSPCQDRHTGLCSLDHQYTVCQSVAIDQALGTCPGKHNAYSCCNGSRNTTRKRS